MLGFLLGITILLQIITGILLGLHYTSDINSAYSSVFFFIREIYYGWCLHYLHSSGASFVFLFLLLHLGRAISYGSYFYNPVFSRPSWCLKERMKVNLRKSKFCSFWYKFSLVHLQWIYHRDVQRIEEISVGWAFIREIPRIVSFVQLAKSSVNPRIKARHNHSFSGIRKKILLLFTQPGMVTAAWMSLW